MDPIDKWGKNPAIVMLLVFPRSEAGGYHGEDLYRWNSTWVLDGFFFGQSKKETTTTAAFFIMSYDIILVAWEF